MSYVIECEHLIKDYRLGQKTVHALRSADLCVEEGEFVAIMGRSGCGKSTLLKILGTQLRPDSGTYLLNGRDITGLPEKEILQIRRQDIGYVFQNFSLIPEYTVWENICMPLYLDRQTPDIEYIETMAEKFGMTDKLDVMPDQLSGGEQQRTAILRAMSHKPKVLLADEPTGNLDYETGKLVMDTLTHIRALYHQTIVMVTHDKECASYADRIYAMKDGKLTTTLE